MAALGLLSACGPWEARYEVKLLTGTCSAIPALEGARYLRFRVTGADMEPVERYVPVDQGTAALPIVPPGKGRVLEVRGYTDLPRMGGRLVALGRSRSFEVPESAGEARPTVSVAVRMVDTYVRPATAQGTCVSLAEPRAAHTATLLDDGRVLLAGGFRTGSEGVDSTVSSAELFDPVTGTVTQVPALGTARAFHTATRLPGGKVLLAGGEMRSVEGALPVRSARVLDVAQGMSTEVELKVARSHHAAAVDSGGRVLLVGGVGAGGAVVAQAEGYDSATGQVFSVSTPVPRVGMAAMPVQDGRRIAVVGGSDGAELRPEVLFFSFEGGSFVPVGEGARLREPRRDAALVPFGGLERLLYVGGYDSAGDVAEARVLASSELVSPGAAVQVSPGPQVFARSGLCAVALPDGRVMTLGGVRYGAGGLVSDPHVELLVPGQNGAATALLGLKPLDPSRHQHSCTVLDDGSVLIAGGQGEDGSRGTTLGDLVIYTPVPLD
ncbi:Branched-chain amino acid ABC transporter, amino acid-binding protein [Archangium gephyra]|uniref:Branched-chain amino acid ABC transporter, amino acid-binding protein n=1 Tax=Archangium gephyra TaxID=48 RepID=A0AAC8Q721_9BACT|nr:Branched-chain amino acid ABC transporter, amino acid-binding protein [Archangium gephyra]